MRPHALGWLILALALAATGSAAAAPRVLVTIAPLHSLVASVTAGVSEPGLLLDAGGSPHNLALRPSQMRALARADVVVWVGEALETSLHRTLESRPERQRIIEVLSLAGMTLDPARDDSPRAGAKHDPGHGHLGVNPHVWLDPANARVIVRAVADQLAGLDPDHAAHYARNALATLARIDALDAALGAMLGPVRDVPFVVFHDAYSGFERRYALRSVGAVTVSPERMPGAAHIRMLRRRIVELGARCAFSEPQFEPRLVATVVEGTGARVGTLDPIGSRLQRGPDLWFELMRALARAMTGCLGDG